jgi:hypothetical protein
VNSREETFVWISSKNAASGVNFKIQENHLAPMKSKVSRIKYFLKQQSEKFK